MSETTDNSLPNRKIHFVFVHGVGNDSPKVFGEEMKENFEKAGLDTSSWTKINWHATVQPGLIPDKSLSGKED